MWRNHKSIVMEYISYIRVSTRRQGKSGLGMEAQRTINNSYVDSCKGTIIAEYSDVESGTHRNREGLSKAINHCKRSGATLVIAKLDRLARDVEFTFSVVNSGITIHFCDMPAVNTMILGVFASVAQYERELTSARTKAALAEKKRRGMKLGAPAATFTADQREKAARSRQIKAEENSQKYIDLITMYREKGMTLQAIAASLNSKGFTTPRGKAFAPATITMYLKRVNQ